MPEGVILQRIRDIVVQIKHTVTNEITGTGFVTKEGIVTSAQAVRDAGVDLKTPYGEVGIYFPEREGRRSIYRKAKIKCFFPEHDDDVLLLCLTDGPSPLPPELVAKLGSAKSSRLHDFISFGYSRVNDFQGLMAYGKIADVIENSDNKKLHSGPIILKSQHVDRKMSGAPVLDIQLNLVVGIISAGWDSAFANLDQDTGFAVDAKVLSLDPLSLIIQDDTLDKAVGSTPKVDITAAQANVAPKEAILWNNSPPSLDEWVGRDDLLDEIADDWVNSGVRITGLIGFGGEGKSSLARRWVDKLLANKSLPQPNGLFWWGFYERRNVDEFFESALNYLSGGKIDASKIPSANMRVQIIAAMLSAGRFYFILDGLEVLQHQGGDLYGSLRNADLTVFLRLFAAPEHTSFCLITSRIPLMDLGEYITYKHRDVDRLSSNDGRNLLRRLGVLGEDKELDRMVQDWDGHALTLSLLASYLQDHHGGDIRHIKDIPPPVVNEPRYDRVYRVLRRYSEKLTPAEQAFLKIFSIFRRPVDEEAFDKAFRVQTKDKPGLLNLLMKHGSRSLNAPLAALNDALFLAMVDRLVSYRLLRRESYNGQFTAHPLVNAFYYDLLTREPENFREANLHAKEYYLGKSNTMPSRPSLEDLRPMLEAAYHACKCGDYDEAFFINKKYIDNGNERYMASKLGAWSDRLIMMLEFFPGNDTSLDPKVSNLNSKSWILNEVGLCLDCLGRGNQAEEFFKRSLRIDLEIKDWINACIRFQNLSYLYSLIGKLDESLNAANESLKLARLSKNLAFETDSFAYLAWSAHLLGDIEFASMNFQYSEKRMILYMELYNYGLSGIWHADHLRRLGNFDYAKRITEANLRCCEREHWLDDISRCHRLMGDLLSDIGQQDDAAEHYRKALDISRKTSHKQVLAEALLARGRWEARRLGDFKTAFSDLMEALELTMAGSYRLYEADIRVALAWTHLAANKKEAAQAEARYSKQLSQEMGYHWGIIDAEEVQTKIAAGN